MKRIRSINMLEGSLTKNIILFTIPLILSGVLQLFFNAADIVVVGQFAGDNALAAVGATSTLINLLVNLFLGLSVGASVVMGRSVGANKREDATDTLHTSIAIAFYGGIALVFIGFLVSKPFLIMLNTPLEVLNLSVLYMSIYFLGAPANMVYNFGAAILRSIGDTKRPLYFLILAGIVNVVLNLILVIIFNLSVAGVAIATIISQYVMAFLIILSLMKSEENYLRLSLKKVKLHFSKVIEILKIGIPAGIQGILFNISNLLIQSSINSFGKIVVAGNTAAVSIEGFIYVMTNSLYQANLTFTSQNVGAKKYERINSILIRCLCIVFVVGLVGGVGAYLCGNVLLGLYTFDNEVIQFGMIRLMTVCSMYFLNGFMDTMVGSLRGIGYSTLPMVVTFIGICVFRVFWVLFIFRLNPSLEILYLSYPLSWILTASIHFISFILAKRHFMRKVAVAYN